jgi:hypothetical protein
MSISERLTKNYNKTFQKEINYDMKYIMDAVERAVSNPTNYITIEVQKDTNEIKYLTNITYVSTAERDIGRYTVLNMRASTMLSVRTTVCELLKNEFYSIKHNRSNGDMYEILIKHTIEEDEVKDEVKAEDEVHENIIDEEYVHATGDLDW